MAEPRYQGDTRPDFDKGNDLATKHGANSERHLGPLVDELLVELERVAPWTSAAAFQWAAHRWAWAEAEVILRRRDFDEHGLTDDEGAERVGTERWHRAERRAALAAEQLGLTPHSMVRLLSGLSSINGPQAQSGLDALEAAGAVMLEKAQQRALSAVPDPEDAA